MPRIRRNSHRIVSGRLFVVYRIGDETFRMAGVELRGFNRPNPRTIKELEKLLAQYHGQNEGSVMLTDYKVM